MGGGGERNTLLLFKVRQLSRAPGHWAADLSPANDVGSAIVSLRDGLKGIRWKDPLSFAGKTLLLSPKQIPGMSSGMES